MPPLSAFQGSQLAITRRYLICLTENICTLVLIRCPTNTSLNLPGVYNWQSQDGTSNVYFKKICTLVLIRYHPSQPPRGIQLAVTRRYLKRLTENIEGFKFGICTLFVFYLTSRAGLTARQHAYNCRGRSGRKKNLGLLFSVWPKPHRPHASQLLIKFTFLLGAESRGGGGGGE